MTFYDDQLKIAAVFDKAVSCINIADTAPDAALALCEEAIGVNIATDRLLDLGFGYAVVSEPGRVPLKLAAGVVRGRTVDTQYLNTASATTLDFHNLPVSDPVENVYLFGRIFLSIGAANGSGTVSYALSLGNNLNPIYAVRDLTPDEALDCIAKGTVSEPVLAISNYAHLAIYDFVLSIDRYDPSVPADSSMSIFVRDTRLPRGWGGYADETMSVSLVPFYQLYYEGVDVATAVYHQAIVNMVAAWVALDIWGGTFTDYWAQSGHALPDALSNFITDNLGTNV